jgi:hypothetical protein
MASILLILRLISSGLNFPKPTKYSLYGVYGGSVGCCTCSFSVSILYMKLAHDNLILKFKRIFIVFLLYVKK